MNHVEQFSMLPHSRGILELEFISKRVAILWLNNPEARNAMSIAMMHSLPDIVHRLQEDSPSLLIIRGRNNHFCAGGDLTDVKEHLLQEGMGSGMCEFMTQYTNALKCLPCFIVVVLEGAAIGGGAELLTLGDWIIAKANAKVGFLQVRLGVSTGWGGGNRLIQRVGLTKTIQLLGLSRVHSAQEAHQLGLVDEVVDSVEVALQKCIERVLKQPSDAFTMLMTWLHRSDETANELSTFTSTWAGPEHCRALGLDSNVGLQKET
mgnify:CR=1 FL=1|jgi:enoyl-CoA hydratase/carnithine racemase